MDYNDEKAWDLYKNGFTKGLFQLESNLGRAWSKRLAPANLEELAALIALIRPGSLKAIMDGKSMTANYVCRKWEPETIEYLHESLTNILKSTKGVLIYQEQSMRIAQELAGFNLQEADMLRKAIGKKKASMMTKLKGDFLKGCMAQGIVNPTVAAEIFGWIEKSSRYSFNKSHAVGYAMDSFWSAWWKANHTKEFFTAYLYYAHQKLDPHQEVYELVSEAKVFGIEVKTPNLECFSEKFKIVGKDIYFGVKDIKSLTGVTGDKVMQAIRDTAAELKKDPSEFSWMEVLLYLTPKINATAFKALCSIGFFSTKATEVSRNKALYEFLVFRELTKAELDWAQRWYYEKQWKTLQECFTELAPTKKEGGGCSRVARSQIIRNEIQMLNSPPYSLSDEPAWIIEQETKMLGCPISLSKVDAVDSSAANTTCKEILNGRNGKNLCVIGNIVRVTNHKIKKVGKNKGKLMSFMTVEDASGSIDSVVVFPDIREKYHFILYENNNLMLCGDVNEDNSFIVNQIHEI